MTRREWAALVVWLVALVFTALLAYRLGGDRARFDCAFRAASK